MCMCWTGRIDALREEWRRPSVKLEKAPLNGGEALNIKCLPNINQFWNPFAIVDTLAHAIPTTDMMTGGMWQPNWWVGGSVTHRLEAGRCSLRPLPWVGMILHKGENPYQKPFRWWAKETRRSSVAFNLNTVITLTETDITDITLKQTSQT